MIQLSSGYSRLPSWGGFYPISSHFVRKFFVVLPYNSTRYCVWVFSFAPSTKISHLNIINQDKIFVFGDNNLRIGKGGQAIIRDLPNSIGIRTKKEPSNKPTAYYKDEEFEINSKYILEDILKIKHLQLSGKTIVFSNGGYGTGLAALKQKSPITFHFLVECLRYFFEFDNETGRSWKSIPSFDEINYAKYITITKDNPDVLVPVNNTFFKSEFLEAGLITYSQLIRTGKKTAFTSKFKFKTGQILNLNLSEDKYLVVRVCGSYPISSINQEQWSLFEGLNTNFIKNKDLNWYQTFFQFVCTLDESGNMLFKDDLFSEITPNGLKSKIVGQPTKIEEEITDGNLLAVKKLLENKGLLGEITKMTGDSNKIKYQVRVDDTYYAVEYKKFLLWDSIEILLTSKNSFI